MDEILGIVLAVFLGLILGFLITRWFWCWYWKINARLHEQQKTNELLQNIFDALIQGNSISAMQVGTTENLKAQIAKGSKKVEEAVANSQTHAQIPKAGEVDNSLPPL